MRYARRVMIREERTRGLEWEEPSIEDAVFTVNDVSWPVLATRQPAPAPLSKAPRRLAAFLRRCLPALPLRQEGSQSPPSRLVPRAHGAVERTAEELQTAADEVQRGGREPRKQTRLFRPIIRSLKQCIRPILDFYLFTRPRIHGTPLRPYAFGPAPHSVRPRRINSRDIFIVCSRRAHRRYPLRSSLPASSRQLHLLQALNPPLPPCRLAHSGQPTALSGCHV